MSFPLAEYFSDDIFSFFYQKLIYIKANLSKC
jgi:hypothetical protein